jgi:hypothetical protein
MRKAKGCPQSAVNVFAQGHGSSKANYLRHLECLQIFDCPSLSNRKRVVVVAFRLVEFDSAVLLY